MHFKESRTEHNDAFQRQSDWSQLLDQQAGDAEARDDF